MKPVCTLSALALALMFVNAAAAQDFRDVNWGASRAEVRAAESAEEMGEEGNRLYFTGEVANKTAAIVYDFLSDGQLANAYYVFSEEHSNRNDYIDDFDEIEEILGRVYGAPDRDEVIWDNDLYRDDPAEYGFAVSIGHTFYVTSYSSETTEINHTLRGENYDISHLISYKSLELAGDAEQEKQQSQDGDF